MKIIIEKDYDAMSQTANSILIGHMCKDGRVNLSLTAGRSPKLMYEKYFVPQVKDKKHFADVHYYSFDETPILNPKGEVVSGDNSSQLYASIFEPANIKEDRIHLLSKDNYKEFDQMIESVGGLDAMLIGIGEDGHFCANMPECTKFKDETYAVELSDDYPWNKPYQDSLGENYSDLMFSMGPRSVMKVRHLILIVNGKEKASIIKEALEGEVRESLPSSVLQLHPNLTVILDEDAASLLTIR